MCQRMPYSAFPHRRGRAGQAEGQRVTALDKKTLSESDICDLFISPAIKGAGWDHITQIRREMTLAPGRGYTR